MGIRSSRLQIEKKPFAQGSNGMVYRGTLNSQPVAVKRIHKSNIGKAHHDEKEMQKIFNDFERECKLLETAKHPHIVTFHGVFDDETQEGGALLVMELMDQTLETFLKENRRNLSKEKQVDICQQIASGVRYLHHRDPQILHRDLKPSNILLDEDGRIAKIGDFGQAKFRPSDKSHLSTQQPGTLPFMPPECLRDDRPRFDSKGDVFSLGVVMLEVATQEPPSCWLEGIGRVPEVDRRAKDLSKVPDDHPLKALIRACLKDDPKERLTIEEVLIYFQLSHPGAWKLYTEVKTIEPKMFRSDVLLKDNKLQSIQLPPLPIPTSYATAIVIGGKIYVSGGSCVNVKHAQLVQVYETITAEWTTLPPSPIYHSESTLVNGQLTLIGGRDASTRKITNSAITWDEEKKLWFPKVPPMPTKRYCPCVIHCDNLMLVAGGLACDSNTLLDSVDIFNMETFQWTTSSSFKLPLPMWLLRASINCGNLYITCGMDSTATAINAAYKLPVNEVFDAITKEQEAQWIQVQSTPNFSSGLLADHPIVVGGFKLGKPTSDVSIYNPTTGKWSNVGQCVRPHLRSWVIAVTSSSFVVIGGCTDPKDPLSSLLPNFELFYV